MNAEDNVAVACKNVTMLAKALLAVAAIYMVAEMILSI